MAHPALHLPRQTRLLNLYQGNPSDSLLCEIDTFDLDNLPPYGALSYAWEESVTSDTEDLPILTEIICNTEILTITANLGRALQHLRFHVIPNHPRRLWIDKLCINQDDVGEREQQIQYMGEIFGKAEHVIVWLGDSDASTATVWKLMANLRLVLPNAPPQTYHLAHGWQPEGSHTGPNPDVSGRAAMLPLPPELGRLPPAHHDSWRFMDAFLNRAWFNRVWTLQEVTVSKRCHVMCGEETLLWEDLCKASTALHNGGYTHFFGAGNASILMREAQRQRWHLGERSSLRSLLCCTRSMETAQAHDKIFGLLPLVESNSSTRLKVQYARELSELFSEVARACIDEDNNLAVLAEVEIRSSDSLEMASWVPDWRKSISTPIVFNAWSSDHKLFNSSGATQPFILSSSALDTLKLRGFLVAPITRIIPIHDHLKLNSVNPRPNKLKRVRWQSGIWERLYTKAAIDCKIPLSVVKAAEQRDNLPPMAAWARDDSGLLPIEMLHVALRRTLSADLYPRPDGRLPESAVLHNFPAYSAWEQRDFDGIPGLPPKQVLWEHDRTVRTTMMNRSAFVAGDDHNAYLGIGLETLKEGDWVCILLGGDTPFILRPLRSTQTDPAFDIDEWSLVSECYVHGLMDGEAMARTCHRRFKYKDFVLPSAKSSHVYSAKL